MLLRRELRKACLHAFHNRADQHSACAKTVKPNVAKTSFSRRENPYSPEVSSLGYSKNLLNYPTYCYWDCFFNIVIVLGLCVLHPAPRKCRKINYSPLLRFAMFHVKHNQGFQAKMWLTLRVHFFGSQIENINVFCLLRLVNYCIFLFGNRRV